MPLLLHFHNTRGTGLANILTALECGVTEFDASVGGLGGCPYAPGATGNVATEEVVHMLHDMGIDTGIDLDGLIEAAELAQRIVGRELPSGVLRAGPRTRLISVVSPTSRDAGQCTLYHGTSVARVGSLAAGDSWMPAT